MRYLSKNNLTPDKEANAYYYKDPKTGVFNNRYEGSGSCERSTGSRDSNSRNIRRKLIINTAMTNYGNGNNTSLK